MAMEATNKEDVRKQGMTLSNQEAVKEMKESMEGKDVAQQQGMKGITIIGKSVSLTPLA